MECLPALLRGVWMHEIELPPRVPQRRRGHDGCAACFLAHCRYCIVVYEQTAGRIEPDEPRVPKASGFPPRRSFKSRAFAAKYSLKPVAAVSFRAQYDDLVPELHKRLTATA